MAKRRLTVEALVIDAGRVLLVRQGARRTGDWEMPGGKVKRRESITAAAVREVLEETGVGVISIGVVAIFHIRDEHTHDAMVRCEVSTRRTPRPRPPEIAAAEWFPIDRLPTPMRPFTRRCILDLQGANVVKVDPIDAEQWVGA